MNLPYAPAHRLLYFKYVMPATRQYELAAADEDILLWAEPCSVLEVAVCT